MNERAGKPSRPPSYGVLAERGPALDVSLVRETLLLLEGALGQSDLTPMLERELDRWRRAER